MAWFRRKAPTAQASLEVAVKQPLTIVVEGGGQYVVEFTVAAVAGLEAKIGRPMRSLQSWLQIQAKDLPAVLEAGLLKHHAKTAAAVAASICDGLNPEGIDSTVEAFAAAACPRAMDRFRKELEKLKARVKDGLPLPKDQSAVVR